MTAQGKVTHIITVVAALAMSGMALADHNPNHGTGKEKPKDPPGKPVSKSGIEVVSLCEPAFGLSFDRAIPLRIIPEDDGKFITPNPGNNIMAPTAATHQGCGLT